MVCSGSSKLADVGRTTLRGGDGGGVVVAVVAVVSVGERHHVS